MLEPRRLLTGRLEMVADLNPAGDEYFHSLLDVDGSVYFTASQNRSNFDLVRTDGRTTEHLATDLPNSPWETFWFQYEGAFGTPVNIGGAIIYAAGVNSPYDSEIWKYDIASGVASVVKDINPATGGFNYCKVVGVSNGIAYFRANDGVSSGLWRTDGTEAGTFLLGNLDDTSELQYSPFAFTTFNGVAYFAARVYSFTEFNTELWRTDGTVAGTYRLKDINPGPDGGVSPDAQFFVRDGLLYFPAYDGVTSGLWRTDGTEAGTLKVADSSGYRMFEFGGDIWFSKGNSELWRYDGSAAVKVIDAAPYLISRYEVTDTAITYVRKPMNNPEQSEFWRTDGTVAGTYKLLDVLPILQSYSVISTHVDGRAFYRSPNDLVITDGTVAGTSRVQITNTYVGDYPNSSWGGAQPYGPGSKIIASGGRVFTGFAPTVAIGHELHVYTPFAEWDGGGDGIHWSDPNNWVENTVPLAGDDVVINAATGSIVIEGDQSVRNLRSSRPLQINGSLTINREATISADISGAGAININGVVRWQGGSISGYGPLTLSAGAVISAETSAVKTLHRTLLGAGTLNVLAGELVIAPGLSSPSPAIVVGALSIANGASIDVTDNTLVIDYTDTSPIDSVDALVRGGFNAGTWTGSGVRSSLAATLPNCSVGFGEATTVVSGLAPDDTSLVIRYTLKGDATLDRVMNFDDLLRVAQHYGTAGNSFALGNVDFDSAGEVNFDDLMILSQQFGSSMFSSPASRQASAGSKCSDLSQSCVARSQL